MFTRIMPWLVGIVLAGIPWTTQGGTVIVSGDVTPVFSLTDIPPNPATPGNRQFFTNILAGGTQVAVLSSTYNGNNAGLEIDSFYDSLGGVTSTLLTGTVTASNLAGVNLFLIPVPSDAFSAAEITTISDFVKGAGTVFLMGEAQDISFGPTTNGFVNSVLSGSGSKLSLVNASLDIGPQVASGSQIAVHPLTANVLAYDYGYTSQVAGGTPLFLAKNGTPFVAVEVIGVPEPSSITLLAAALGCVAAYAWRRRRQIGV